MVVTMEAGGTPSPSRARAGFISFGSTDVRGADAVLVDQLRIRHILIQPSEVLDSSAAEQRLRGIHQQILAGDDFAAVAPERVRRSGLRRRWRRYGRTDPTVFVPEFQQVIAALELGELSEPFQTRFGWHIAEVMDRRSYDTTAELREQGCVEQIRTSKLEEEHALWLRRLRDEAFVEVRL